MFDCALAVVASSVTGWLDYLFNIWPFGTMKRCPIALKSCQSWTQTFEVLLKGQKFAQSGHTGCVLSAKASEDEAMIIFRYFILSKTSTATIQNKDLLVAT